MPVLGLVLFCAWNMEKNNNNYTYWSFFQNMPTWLAHVDTVFSVRRAKPTTLNRFSGITYYE